MIDTAIAESQKYKWKFGKYPVTAAEAAQCLAEIEAEYGYLTPDLVVERSKNSSFALHKCFEWDDAVAANKHRREQARHLIGDLVIVYPTADLQTTPREVRIYHNIIAPEPDAQVQEYPSKTAYLSISRILPNQSHKTKLLLSAFKDFRNFYRKYGHLNELAKIWPVVKEMAETLGIDWNVAT